MAGLLGAGCALATLAMTMLFVSRAAADTALAALAVPLALAAALLAIDFAWTPWRAARAERRRRDAAAAEPPPDFDDTQATWRRPLAGEGIAEAPLRS